MCLGGIVQHKAKLHLVLVPLELFSIHHQGSRPTHSYQICLVVIINIKVSGGGGRVTPLGVCLC